MKKNNFILLLLPLSFAACKNNWLEEKRDISLTVPTTLNDMRLLLNNDLLQYDCNGMAEASSDDYYLLENYYNIVAERERNMYTWNKTIYPDQLAIDEWNYAYKQVFYSNVVREGLIGIHPSAAETATWNTLCGEALFYRSKCFYHLAQLFAPAYDISTASTALGIPLRLTADVNATTTRAFLRQVYEQILADLRQACRYLPDKSQAKSQPTTAAAHALLARCLLSMRRYSEAKADADTALMLHPSLLDFKSLNATSTYPVPPNNEEIIYNGYVKSTYATFSSSIGVIDSTLYRSYAENDLRKTIFARKNTNGTMGFKGNFTGSSILFTGSTTGEQLLIRAECQARAGHYSAALADLNTLLEKRCDASFSPITEPDGEVLGRVMQERRKELLRRGIRWTDLRRLNLESGEQHSLTRIMGGQTFTLPANDPRYVLPIPDYVIQATGIPQNVRN